MNLRRKLKTARNVWQVGGWRAVKQHLRWKNHYRREVANYQKWVQKYDALTETDRQMIRKRIQKFAHKSLISVVMPVYNIEEKWLRLAIESVLKQLYQNWELCIADDNSTKPHVRRVLEEYAAQDTRIKIVFREVNGHISAASNSALDLATGEFVALLDHDDELSEHALYFVAEELNAHPETDMIYSDEDMIDECGRRYGPKFKPDWSRDLFYSLNLITHLSVYRTSVLRKIGGFRLGAEGSQDYDLALRVIEEIPENHIRHIPHILYYWRAIPGSVASGTDQKPYAHERAREAIRAHLARIGVKADVVEDFSMFHRVIYHLPEKKPAVSLILTADESAPETIESILQRTNYAPFEIIVASNQELNLPADARLRILKTASTNAAATNNLASQEAQGDVLVFLKSGLSIEKDDWLRELVSHAWRAEVGAVGAKILLPNGFIKHAGFIIGINRLVGNAHFLLLEADPGYFARAQVINNFSAVSAECLAIRRSLFWQISGFDETNLPNALFDVDLCLRLQENGYRIVWTPHAELRIIDLMKTSENGSVSANESSYFKRRWRKIIEKDPFYNPNLTRRFEDFSLQIPPRKKLLPFRC